MHDLITRKNISLGYLTSVLQCITVQDMTKKSPPSITIRPTFEDKKLIAELRKKLGVEVSQLIRLGLRALATKEGVTP